MQKNKIVQIAILSLGISISGYSQEKVQTPQSQLTHLLMQRNFDSSNARKYVQEIKLGDNEQDWMLISNYYYRIGNNKMVTDLKSKELKKFPMGYLKRDAVLNDIYNTKETPKLDTMYHAFMVDFPPAKFNTGKEGDLISYDYVTSYIANLYASKKDSTKAEYYIQNLKEDFWKGNAYIGLAKQFEKVGLLHSALKYAQLAVDATEPYYSLSKEKQTQAIHFAMTGFNSEVTMAADLMARCGQPKEALSYFEKESIHFDNPSDISLVRIHAQLLVANHQNEKALPLYESIAKSGKATAQDIASFKACYKEINGSDANFEAYVKAINQQNDKDLKDNLSKSVLHESAPNFTLKDLDGKEVKLSDYKGKVVVLDFWATWCGPCKASFPAMQMTINKYKNDKDVVFLFIHTWESSKTPQADVKQFLKGKDYTFRILFDQKNPTTNQNDVVESYHVDGIPAKFVIDKEGFINFKLKGFDGSNEAAVNELSTMIEIAKKQ